MTTRANQLIAAMAGIALGEFPGFRLPPGWSAPAHALRLRKCDPSRHNTLRHDQVERRRKLRRKLHPPVRYRRLHHDNRSE